MKKVSLTLIFILLAALLAACGGRNSSQSGSSDLDISVQAGSMAVGTTDLMITVKDKDGNPINDASVSIKGDMAHAGMAPVLGETDAAVDGVYTIPYEWTMAGDWFVTVDVTLADGTTASERVDFSGIGEGEMDHSDQ